MVEEKLYELYSDYETIAADWLWYPYIPYSKITIIQGGPGEGKTSLVLQLAATLSNGESLITQKSCSGPINIIYQSAEDGIAYAIVPRLIAAGVNRNRIAFIDENDAPLSMGDMRLEEAIIQHSAKLLVLDPLQAYLGADTDIASIGAVREKKRYLAGIAQRTGCAIVLVGHMNKSSSSKGIYRELGSIDFAAANRSILLVGRAQEGPTIRVMAHIKSSLAPEGPAIAFECDKEYR